jgi:CRP-like cAMP-binding protein
MMDDNSAKLLDAITEIRDLLRLIAEPQIAARDTKLRDELRRIVGRSMPKQKSIFLMDGTRTQADIAKQSGIGSGHMSELVKELRRVELVSCEVKTPALTISIPTNFFDANKSNGR